MLKIKPITIITEEVPSIQTRSTTAAGELTKRRAC